MKSLRICKMMHTLRKLWNMLVQPKSPEPKRKTYTFKGNKDSIGYRDVWIPPNITIPVDGKWHNLRVEYISKGMPRVFIDGSEEEPKENPRGQTGGETKQ